MSALQSPNIDFLITSAEIPNTSMVNEVEVKWFASSNWIAFTLIWPKKYGSYSPMVTYRLGTFSPFTLPHSLALVIAFGITVSPV